MWNAKTQNSKAIAIFKSKSLSFVRRSERSIFNINNPEGVNYLTRLRLRFSHLNEHKFRHGFLDTLNPLCNCNLEVEDNEHFLCANSILKMLEGPSLLTYQALIHLLKICPVIWNSNCFFLVILKLFILKASIKYIMTTNRFPVPLFWHCFPSLALNI